MGLMVQLPGEHPPAEKSRGGGGGEREQQRQKVSLPITTITRSTRATPRVSSTALGPQTATSNHWSNETLTTSGKRARLLTEAIVRLVDGGPVGGHGGGDVESRVEAAAQRAALVELAQRLAQRLAEAAHRHTALAQLR